MAIENMEANDRVPVILLDYSQRWRAHKKELLFDYNEGKLYVVSADDKSRIFDITQRILDLVSTDISADGLIVNIDGVGSVNLKQYITNLKAAALNANTFGGKAPVPNAAYDFNSIVNKDGIIMISDFHKAKEDQVPVCRGGVVRWDYSTAVEPVHTVQPDVDYMVRLKDVNNVTTLENGCTLHLTAKNPSGSYNVINWCVKSGDIVPRIRIASDINLYQEYKSDLDIDLKAVHIYKFESFDGGMTWFESVKKYTLRSAIIHDRIDYDFLLDNYYTKSEVNELMRWKNSSGQSFYDGD
jgi:hypothetical protein